MRVRAPSLPRQAGMQERPALWHKQDVWTVSRPLDQSVQTPLHRVTYTQDGQPITVEPRSQRGSEETIGQGPSRAEPIRRQREPESFDTIADTQSDRHVWLYAPVSLRDKADETRCFRKCINSKISSGKLDRSEEPCMQNCVDRYMDANMTVIKHLEQMRTLQ